MNLISNILYWISTGLLVPVIVLLIYFFIRALILIGAFFSQYMVERKTSVMLQEKITTALPSQILENIEAMPASGTSLINKYLKEVASEKGNEARMQLIVSEYEIAAEKNIAGSKILTKMGPILGLMGTLIPMGPALVGLATGDIASMAYNMQVAFATTVVGLVVSAIGFVTQQARERWATRNLVVLDYVVQSL
ncbi:MAG: MotA/TolQ/ExbB proton channel family protein, partial [Paramuribaculum sp.]|nr:MotA/TolQ/ExbB proton channel family protein [Paramuribaculum sp.]